jgi:hypothetical protein
MGGLFVKLTCFTSQMTCLWRLLKGIVQPFELGGVTMLIRSAVKKTGGPASFFIKFFNDTIS